MIQPVQQDQALLEDIARAERTPDRFHVWWLGQSGFLIQWNGQHLLFDPYLSDSLTRKYADTDKPHVRMTERVVDPVRLGMIDVVTSSHNHTDHLDAETLNPLLGANPELQVVVPVANQSFAAERLQMAPNRLTPIAVDAPIQCGPFTLRAVPAAHNELSRDDQGHYKFIGIVASFGEFNVYHSGDTLHYDGMEDWIRRDGIRIDLALLPINGNKPERRVAGNLDGRETAQLATDLEAGLVVPCHYEMFEFNTESPDLFESTCTEIHQPFKTMRAGERLTI